MEYYNESWLALTLDIINTYDPYYKVSERLNTVDQLQELIQKHGMFLDKSPTLKDVSVIRDFRDKIRKQIIEASDKRLSESLMEYESRSSFQRSLYPIGSGKFKFVYHQLIGNNYSFADRIIAICAFTLGEELVNKGRLRLKQCASVPCEEIFVDHSKNGQQRFCSKRCSTRFHVKKHRGS
ncbi:CGNR zinc finger domain-containing protein [Alkalihalobacillus sp. AL-G]|uniref:CGNR zinc finger domain-containing protein n=1 Tax=Alkalihalobacillus sp. AL-G TaxID=2926399 RepID=UPI00272CC6A0|nr:CGNR zinc finger domain-containing protein [Alkalihalobacillus sp. AL-G]WLD92854.1 CGNR zinc finger domain-containing protein [Alkalihalobacillus sp. AL-G]